MTKNLIKSLIIIFSLFALSSCGPLTAADVDREYCSEELKNPESDDPAGTPKEPNIIIVQPIIDQTAKYMEDALEDFFDAVQDSSIQLAAQAALVLYITLYGASVAMGVVAVRVDDLIDRCIRIGLVMLIISDGAWEIYDEYVVTFIIEGGKELFGDASGLFESSMLTAETGYTHKENQPFLFIDHLISTIVNPGMFAVVQAMMLTGPYGIIFFIVTLFALLQFLMALFEIAIMYLVALLMKVFLLGLGPIFFCFIPFERTRDICASWTKMLVSFSLQPVIMILYYSFAVELMLISMDPLLGLEVCWASFNIDGNMFAGGAEFWRFVDSSGDIPTVYGPDDPFPLSIIDLLTFAACAYIIVNLNSVVMPILSSILNVWIDLQTIAKQTVQASATGQFQQQAGMIGGRLRS